MGDDSDLLTAAVLRAYFQRAEPPFRGGALSLLCARLSNPIAGLRRYQRLLPSYVQTNAVSPEPLPRGRSQGACWEIYKYIHKPPRTPRLKIAGLSNSITFKEIDRPGGSPAIFKLLKIHPPLLFVRTRRSAGGGGAGVREGGTAVPRGDARTLSPTLAGRPAKRVPFPGERAPPVAPPPRPGKLSPGFNPRLRSEHPWTGCQKQGSLIRWGLFRHRTLLKVKNNGLERTHTDTHTHTKCKYWQTHKCRSLVSSKLL